jgi:hypothetical protein
MSTDGMYGYLIKFEPTIKNPSINHSCNCEYAILAKVVTA